MGKTGHATFSPLITPAMHIDRATTEPVDECTSLYGVLTATIFGEGGLLTAFKPSANIPLFISLIQPFHYHLPTRPKFLPPINRYLLKRSSFFDMADTQDETERVEYMVQRLQDRQSSTQMGPDTSGICMLSLDGCGVRGYSSLMILQSLMAKVNAKRRKVRQQNQQDPLPDVKPCDVFDLIGGTSTGG